MMTAIGKKYLFKKLYLYNRNYSKMNIDGSKVKTSEVIYE